MAGTVVHLVIADMLSQEWHNTKVVTPYGSIKLIKQLFYCRQYMSRWNNGT